MARKYFSIIGMPIFWPAKSPASQPEATTCATRNYPTKRDESCTGRKNPSAAGGHRGPATRNKKLPRLPWRPHDGGRNSSSRIIRRNATDHGKSTIRHADFGHSFVIRILALVICHSTHPLHQPFPGFSAAPDVKERLPNNGCRSLPFTPNHSEPCPREPRFRIGVKHAGDQRPLHYTIRWRRANFFLFIPSKRSVAMRCTDRLLWPAAYINVPGSVLRELELAWVPHYLEAISGSALRPWSGA